VSRAARCALVGIIAISTIICDVVLCGDLKLELKPWLPAHCLNIVPSALSGECQGFKPSGERIAESSPMWLAKSIDVIDLPENIEASPGGFLSFQNFQDFISSERIRSKDVAIQNEIRGGRSVAPSFCGQLRKREIIWKGMGKNLHDPSLIHRISWSLSAVYLSGNKVERRVGIYLIEPVRCNEYVSAQFPLGRFHEMRQLALTGIPKAIRRTLQLPSESPYGNRSEGGNSSAELIKSFANLNEKERQEAIGGAIFVFGSLVVVAYLVIDWISWVRRKRSYEERENRR
jgi:hypothetical protein